MKVTLSTLEDYILYIKEEWEYEYIECRQTRLDI